MIFTLPRPTMMDSNINEEKGEGVYSNKVHYELEETATNTYALTLEADDEWLSSDKRVYPVYIDPSVTATALGDTYVSSKYPTANFNKKWDATQGEYVLQTGYYDSTSGTNYAYIKFDINDLKGATIDNAQLSTYVTHAYYKAEQNGLWVDAVNDIWYTASLNWNNKPSSTKITSVNVGRDEWANFNVTDTVQSWMSGETRNNGFKLHTNGHGKTYWKKISAAENTNKPKIVVKYHYEAGPKPTVSATAYNDGSNNGYTNVKWNAVYGATGYKLLLYDGAAYKEVYTGTATSWSSKGKKIFPKSPYTTSSTYVTDGSGVELPNDPSTFFAKKGTADYLYYKFRVVPTFATGDGTQSEFSRVKIPKETKVVTDAPDQPTIVGHQYSETSSNKGRGWLDISWNKVDGATSYKVLIWNGTKYDTFNVGNKTSVTTKGKKIYPTDDEIAAGTLDFHQASLADTSNIGTGAELPMYPGKSYNNTSKRYSVRIVAVSDAGDSARSEIAYGFIPLYAPKSADVTLKANEDDLVENKTTLTASWKNNELATLYDVTIKGEKSKFNKTYRVKATSGDTTTYTPSTTFDLDDTYEVYVQPYFYDSQNAPSTEADDSSLDDVKRGISPMPSKAQATAMPDLKEDLIGLEDYFTYEEQSFGNATANVNVTTGNMALQFTDESLYTRGDLGYDFLRTYNSRSTKDSALGKGWTFVGNESLSEDENGNILYEDEDGTLHTFKKNNEKYISPKGLYENLTKVDELTYKMINKNGFVQLYKKSHIKNQFLLMSYEDEFKNKILFTRNEDDQIILVEEANNISIQPKMEFHYIDGKISKIKYGDHWTSYFYENDMLTKSIIGSDLSNKTIQQNYIYDKGQILTKYIDAKKNETNFSFDKNKIQIVTPSEKESEVIGDTTLYEFNENQNQYTVTNYDGVQNLYTRDKINNSYVVKDILTNDEMPLVYSYDENYNIISIENSNGKLQENKFDSNGNLLEQKNEENITTYKYNSDNKMIESTSPTENIVKNYTGKVLDSIKTNDETTHFKMDDLGRITETIYPDGKTQKVIYKDESRKTILIDNLNNKSIITYSEYGQKISEIDENGNEKKYEYDPVQQDKIIANINAKGIKTSYEYDKNDNLIKITDGLGRVKNYIYNNNNQLTSVRNPFLEYNYEYNSSNAISKIELPSLSSKHYNYDEYGNITSIILKNKEDKEIENIQYQYNDNNNLSKVLINDEESKTFNYENNLLVKAQANDFISTYEYDNQDRENKRLLYNQENQQQIFSRELTYQENTENINEINFKLNDEIINNYFFEEDVPNKSSSILLNNGFMKIESQMNSNGLLSEIKYLLANGTFSFKNAYLENGNISSYRDNDNEMIFNYDTTNQLISEKINNNTINNYIYDDVGNRISSEINNKHYEYTYNDANQITEKNGVGYTYDANGNLLKDENYHYNYDDNGNLKELYDLKENKILARYEYDDNGIRTSKLIDGKKYSYFYNDNLLEMEKVEENGEIKKINYYIWNGINPLGLISIDSKGNKEVYHYITNYRGDVVKVVDSKNKEVASYQYDSFGNILNLKGELSEENSIRYAGYYYDSETDNYYLQNRYYNPANGVFLSLDVEPGNTDEPLTQHGYIYANNDPVNNGDYTGETAYPLPNITKMISEFMVAISAVITTSWMLTVAIKDFLVDTYNVLREKYAKIKTKPKYKTKTEVHHIVAQSAQKALVARNILKGYSIKVKTDSRNLVALKTGMHRRLHTTVYYQGVNEIIKTANGNSKTSKSHRNTVLRTLKALKRGLLVINKVLPW